MTDEQGAGVCELEGRYTNYFTVGHNAFEVVLVFGQFYEGNREPQLHTRIVTGPAYAKKLLEVLDHAHSMATRRLSVRSLRSHRMSDYSVLSAVSSSLQAMLTNNITNGLAVPLNVPIQLFSPPDMNTAGVDPGNLALALQGLSHGRNAERTTGEAIGNPNDADAPARFAALPGYSDGL